MSSGSIEEADDAGAESAAPDARSGDAEGVREPPERDREAGSEGPAPDVCLGGCGAF